MGTFYVTVLLNSGSSSRLGPATSAKVTQQSDATRIDWEFDGNPFFYIEQAANIAEILFGQ